jgi:hypothetical protein
MQYGDAKEHVRIDPLESPKRICHKTIARRSAAGARDLSARRKLGQFFRACT